MISSPQVRQLLDLRFLIEFPVPMLEDKEVLALCDPGNITGIAVEDFCGLGKVGFY